MKREYILLGDCVDRAVYRVHSRNLSVGVYRAETKGFIGIRVKFGDRYLFTEYHYDTGAPFGTVFPKEQIAFLPDDIPLHELLQHEFGGTSFAIDPATNLERSVLSRDLVEGEAPHGNRRGFTNEWGDTKKRLPDDLFPYVKENKALFQFLDNIQILVFENRAQGEIR